MEIWERLVNRKPYIEVHSNSNSYSYTELGLTPAQLNYGPQIRHQHDQYLCILLVPVFAQ